MRSIMESKAKGAELEATVIEVGIKDQERRIAPLAMQLEFGNVRTRLPERPAFRAGVERLPGVIQEHQATWSGMPTQEQLAALAVDMRDTIRESYLNFHGLPLSERQRERKEGTPGAGKQLIGHEGPKLVEHIGSWVNDNKVD